MAFILKSAFLMLLTCNAVRSQGTTMKLEDIFTGRCLNYNIERAGSLTPIPVVNCDELWSNFSSSWAFKDSCGRNTTSYDKVFGFSTQTLPKDKALFWSGTMDFAHRFSNNGKRYVTLEDTLFGYIANGLKWCGLASTPGINYMNCPAYMSCPGEVVSSYWLGASQWFAAHAQGEIRVALNGSSPNRRAYRKDSIFATVEVPNLRSGIVTKVIAIVVHDLGKPIVESCESPSLIELKADVLAKNLAFDCIDNPPDVKYLLCSDSPDSFECRETNPGCIVSAGVGLIKADRGLYGHFVILFTMVTSTVMKLFMN